MNPDITESQGACHCGTVRFRVKLPDGLNKPRRCTCSLCRMRGAVAVSARVGELTVTQRRSNPGEYGVNVACLEGVSPFDFDAVPVTDGVNHSSDTGVVARVVGVLRFEPVGS
jgi:hypothetical protein